VYALPDSRGIDLTIFLPGPIQYSGQYSRADHNLPVECPFAESIGVHTGNLVWPEGAQMTPAWLASPVLKWRFAISVSTWNLHTVVRPLARNPAATARISKGRLPAVLFALLATSSCIGADSIDPPEEEDWDEICDLGAPTPMLEASAYTNYRKTVERAHLLVESALIDARHRVVVSSSSCADSVLTTIRLSVRNAPSNTHDINHWSHLAKEQIQSLKMVEPATRTLPHLLEFLSNLPDHETGIDSLMICLDGTPSDQDGCPWRSGGSHGVSFRQEGAWMTVTVTEDTSH
jgi:hypothetical protein